MRRLAVLTSVVAVMSLGLAGPALAATPGNDTYATRQVITSLPFTDSLDTSEATTDALDAEVSADCGAPFTDASVWYELVPDADGLVILDAYASDYAVGLIVLTGTPGSFTLEACSGGAVALPVSTGVTITLLVFDYDGVGNGGNLELTIDMAPPPPVLDLTVDSGGSFDSRTGLATIRGTITCTGGDVEGKNFIDVQLTQTVGRFRFNANGGTGFSCDGTTQAWAVELTSDSGNFGGGKASVVAFAFACTFDCAEDMVERVVTLRK
jgi:hypothetical protein